MKAIKIITLSTLCVVICIAVLISISAKMYLKPEIIKDTLRFELEKQFKRPVSIRTVEIHLLQGILLHDVQIQKSLPSEHQNIFSCEKVDLAYSLVPILFKKLLIRKITVTNPHIHLKYNTGKPFRLIGMQRPYQPDNTTLGIIFLPKSIFVRRGTITLHDQKNAGSFALRHVELTVDNLSIISPSAFTIAASTHKGNASDVSCTGELHIRNKELQADITLSKIALEPFGDYLKKHNIPLQKGFLDAQSHLIVTASKSMIMTGTCLLSKASLAILPSAGSDQYLGLDSLDATLNFESVYEIPKGRLTLKSVKGSILSSPYEGSGVIRYKNRAPVITGSLRSDAFVLDDIFDRLQPGPYGIIKNLKLSGNTAIRISLNGKLDAALFPTVLINLRNNQILYPGLGSFRPEVQGSIRIDNKNISLADLKIGIPHASVTLAGDISDYRQWPPRSNVKVVSSYLNFYDLFTPAETASYDEIGPLDLDKLSFKGPIRLGNISFFGMALGNVTGKYLFENNTLFIKNLKGSIEQGDFNLSTTVDFAKKGFDYYLHLEIDDAPLKTITSVFPNVDSRFFDGEISGTSALKGTGTEPLSFIKNLKGDALLNIYNGSVRGLALMPQLTSFVKSSELREIKLNKAQLQLRLRNGIVGVDGIFLSPRLEMYPVGEARLDSSLDLEAKLRVAPEIFTGSTSIARYLPQDDGWTSLPLTIQGTLYDPDVSLSEEAIQFILKESLPRLLADILSEKNTETETAAPAGRETEAESEEAVEQDKQVHNEQEQEADTEDQIEEELEDSIENEEEPEAEEELLL